MTRHSSHFIRALLILFIIGYALFFSVQLILHYDSFGSRALDLGNMGQAIWNTSQGRWFHQTNQPGVTNRLSLHVEPILIPISLLYRFYSGPEILFIFQSIVVALGALPVFALARLKLKNEGLALVFALVYLMFPAIQGATLLDFHAVTLAPTFLLAAFYFLETRRPWRFALFAVLAIACKEEITLLIMMMGLHAIVINRQIRWGAITIGLCLVWAFIAVFVIPPIFANTQNIHWGRYSHLGESPADIMLNMVRQPSLFLNHLQAVNALGYCRQLLAPTAFLALLNPITLLLALPSLGINLLSNFPPMQEVNSLIYAAPVIPAVMISSIYGVANLKRIGEWACKKVRKWQVASGKLHNTQYVIRNNNYPLSIINYQFFIALLLLTATLIYHARYGYFPGGGQYRGWEEVTDHHRRAAQIFAQIPPEAKLSAQDRLNPHVSQRETLYIFDQIGDADHILLDITQDSWPLHPVALRQRVDEFLAADFGVVAALDGYLLLAKNRPDLPAELPDQFFDFARAPNPGAFTPQFSANVTFDGKLQLLGYSLSLGAHEQFLPVITLYWRALEPPAKDYALWPFFINRNGQLIEDPSKRPLIATLWYPTSRWSPDEIMMTSTLPVDLAPMIGDQFTLAVGVAQSNWADPSQRLPITQADTVLYTLNNNTWARLGTFERVGRKEYQPIAAPTTLPQHAGHVQFWNLINLQGYDLPQTALEPGDRLPFTLYWHSVAPITVDLTTFAHLRDSAGVTVAQLDWTPQDSLGYLPTSAWQPDRMVIDNQSLSLPDDLPPGEYQLVVGWYYAPTGERLPVTGSDVLKTDDGVIEVGSVTVR
jgi:uncharacterized membrane protein